MRRIGLSIYPEQSTVEADIKYLQQGSSLGFTRVFSCLLSPDYSKTEVLKKYGKINSVAKDLGYEVTLDVNPAVFEKYEISYDDLSFFAKLKVDVLRLDEAYDGKKEALMTYNEYDIKIEINMSNDTSYLNTIFDHQPKADNLYGCHNFYPQINTGLDMEYFLNCTKRFKVFGINTAAFVKVDGGSMGPWNPTAGLCTLEHHRELKVTTQAKELWATNLIDDVIIGNGYATYDELLALSKLNRYLLELEVEFVERLDDVSKQITCNTLHVRRGDVSEHYIRSTEVRKKYTNRDILAKGERNLMYGDVVVGNNEFGKYKGELQIILTGEYTTMKNKVGTIVDEEKYLTKYIKSWTKFKLVDYENN